MEYFGMYLFISVCLVIVVFGSSIDARIKGETGCPDSQEQHQQEPTLE